MCLDKGWPPRAATVIDHITPLAHGGTDTDDNVRSLCDQHHRDVTAEQFGWRQCNVYGLDGWPVWREGEGQSLS
jgi:5-methylcytosine-specific restriction protein A